MEKIIINLPLLAMLAIASIILLSRRSASSFKGLLLLLSLLLLVPMLFAPVTIMAQVSSPLEPAVPVQEAIVGPTFLWDAQNFDHLTGYRIFVPPNWTIDVRNSEEDGRVRSPQFSIGDTYDFELPAELCPYDKSIPPDIVGGESMRCGEGSSISNRSASNVQVFMYDHQKCGCSDPLDYHLEMLKEKIPGLDTVSVVNIIDTVINYTDPRTKETIQQLPAKRADILATSRILNEQFVDSILYATVDLGDPASIDFQGRDIYVVSSLKPVSPGEVTPSAGGGIGALLDPTVQQIFDSFLIVPNFEQAATATTLRDTATTNTALESRSLCLYSPGFFRPHH